MSGGERSFATLALLLALGASNESPFRVMDEFDVFMDSVARQAAMKELVSFARGMQSKQFIFLTPNSLTGLSAGPDIKIHKMAGKCLFLFVCVLYLIPRAFAWQT